MLLYSGFLACAGLTLCSAAVLPRSSSSEVLLPKPEGRYQVGRSVVELVDGSRFDLPPFAPEKVARKLMVSLFYPVWTAHPHSTGKYFPPVTAGIEDLELSEFGLKAPNGTFEKVGLHLASDKVSKEFARRDKNHHGPHHPLVIFMPGEGTTRLFYQQIVSTIASKGYNVVSIDAPYDVDIVEYTDGSIAEFNLTLWGTSNLTELYKTGNAAITARVADVSFVLDQLANSTLAHSLVPNLPHSGFNTTHTAMFGHSLGGSTAYSVIQTDDRILGGLNMDGGLYGPGLTTGTDKPFMLMGAQYHTRGNKTAEPYATWETAWPHLTGWKKDIIITDTAHYDFSDYPILFETLGITPTAAVGAGGLHLGTLEGVRALHIVTTYVAAFLNFVLHDKSSELLDGPVKQFPEVTFEV
jgi:dienelactone hydrolase